MAPTTVPGKMISKKESDRNNDDFSRIRYGQRQDMSAIHRGLQLSLKGVKIGGKTLFLYDGHLQTPTINHLRSAGHHIL